MLQMNNLSLTLSKSDENSRRDLQQLRTGRLPMIDDAALELVALSEFSRSDHEEDEEEEEQGGECDGDGEWNGRNICFLRSHLGHWWVTSVRVVSPVLPTISNVPVLRLPIKTCQKISLFQSNRYSPIFFKPATGARMSFPDVHCCKRMLQVTIGPRTLKNEDMKPR